MDGTLLNQNDEVSEQFFQLFKKLQEKNIHFAAASGRQYDSIVKKLARIKDDIFVVAENGGIVKQKEEVLLMNTIKAEKLAQLIPVLRKIENSYLILCGKNAAYIETIDDQFIEMFQEYYTSFRQVDDLMEVVHDTDFLKIAIYHFESSEEFIYPKVKHLENDFLIKISGQHWLDISDGKSNKGIDVQLIQEKLNISKEETLVFGDFHNDLEMLAEGEFSFAMGNAPKDIKKAANFETLDNNNFGVEVILEKLIQN